ncbi:hypothetical protein AB0K12_30090 [Nonomuraea sp. NPDC049419]|uniref:hypothetical protein n=1 Tax=Nonomuraea sp. NPDC049419 TaxID=3155772 RepID=UPI00343F2B6D
MTAICDLLGGRPRQVRTARGLLVARHETTAKMIGEMMPMPLADRGRWGALRW